MAKAYKVVCLVTDYDDSYDADEIEVILNQNKYLDIDVMDIESRDIGEWRDDHPLNFFDTDKAEFKRLFGIATTDALADLRAVADRFAHTDFILTRLDGDNPLYLALRDIWAVVREFRTPEVEVKP